jgi:hypothetical protein
MPQSNLSRFYQKRQKKNNELLSGIISGRSKFAKTKKNSPEASTATPSATVAASRRTEEFSNSRSSPEFEISEQRAESQRFETLEPRVIIEKRAELPATKMPIYEIIDSDSAATSPAETSLVTAAAAETTTSTNKKRRTEVGSVRQHSDGNIRKILKCFGNKYFKTILIILFILDVPLTHKQASHIIEYLDKINNRQIKIERDVSDVRRMLEGSKM